MCWSANNTSINHTWLIYVFGKLANYKNNYKSVIGLERSHLYTGYVKNCIIKNKMRSIMIKSAKLSTCAIKLYFFFVYIMIIAITCSYNKLGLKRKKEMIQNSNNSQLTAAISAIEPVQMWLFTGMHFFPCIKVRK